MSIILTRRISIMLTYDLQSEKGTLYELLYANIRNDILSGELTAGYKLPSKRSLAKHLSISVVTVEAAYNQLISEGFICSVPRSGFYVSDIFDSDFYSDIIQAPKQAPDNSQSHDNSHSTDNSHSRDNSHSTDNSHSLDYDFSHGNQINSDNSDNIYIADFASNSNEPSSFPFTTWARISRRILSEDQSLLMTNSPSNGSLLLRQSISDYLKQFRGIDAPADNIIIGAGTEYLYTILLQLFGASSTYATETPGYIKLSKILDTVQLPHHEIAMDESGIIVDELYRTGTNVVHVTPSHHFPTGITMPIGRRYELLKWADSSADNYIIEDDYDSEFRLVGRPIPSLYSIDAGENVIYMNTFTKTLSSTIRISYMVLPDKLANLYHEKLSFLSCTVSTFEQLTLSAFIREGHFETHINRMRTQYRRKRDMLINEIKKSPISSITHISENNAGLHFVVHFDTDISDDKLTEALRSNGINLLPLSSFGDNTEHNYLLNYSSVPTVVIKDAVNLICKCLADQA